MTPGPDAFMPVSVVVPAHNEQAVIERCLSSLLAGAETGELDIVVVCNGCDDRTAEVARRVAPEATVLELAVASKIAALNAGDAQAKYFPRFYVDADVEFSIGALRQVAAVLSRAGLDHGGALCAAPKPVFDLEGRTWMIRAFYEVWKSIPYHGQEMIGSGVYALSEVGRHRFGAFPELTADDQFVQQLFELSERKAVLGAEFVVHPPRSLRGLLAMRARAYRGNRELALSGLARVSPPPSGVKSALRRALQPAQAPAVTVYVVVNILAKGMARRASSPRWERDDSARLAAGAAPGPSRAAGGREGGPVHMCYVTSHYPALSPTFVVREITGVRAAGLEVDTVSVHQADPGHLLAEDDKQEAARTWNIFPLRGGAFLRSHLRAATRYPSAYFSTLGHALASAPPGWHGRAWQLFYFGEAIALWDHAQALGARHFHAHLANVAADISWLAAAFGELAQPRQGWRWSFTMHGSTEFYSIEKFNLARKVTYASAVVCVSEYTKSQLMYLSEPRCWAKLHVVHCGVDLERYRYVPPGRQSRVSVLCVSRLVPGKGLELLVRAIAELCGQGTDVRLVLVGNGPLDAGLRRAAVELGVEDKIVFEGAVGQDDLAGYYARADIFCLPSFAEGVPVVLMEAMASGRPVVATRITGVPELVEDGVSGLLVVPGNAQELTRAIGALAASAEMRESFGLAGRRKVEAAFDSKRCAAQLAIVFSQMSLAN